MANLPVFWPVKGRGNVQVSQVIGTSTRFVDGEEILAYHIAEDNFKWQLLKMIGERAKRMKKGEPVIHFPQDVDLDADFMAEFLSERPVEEKDRFGRVKWVWKRTDDPNDFWDCVKYALALWTIKRPFLLAEGMARAG
jgi:phage terminase large subunit GpA-like protein